MSNIKNELKSIAVEVNNLLDSYIRIHDAVFRFSWRKIIPLPFIFKVIDFNDLAVKQHKFYLNWKPVISKLIM